MPNSESNEPGAKDRSNESKAYIDRARWLTLKDASAFLGVHYTTMRNWADSGDIRVFRTPGGHRRFSVDDLRAFLNERAENPIALDSTEVVDAAVLQVRQELQSTPHEDVGWRYTIGEDEEASHRERGRQLFSLAISYILKPNHRQRILQNGRELGVEYGRDAARHDLGLRETGKAVQFFRGQLTQLLRQGENPRTLDSDDVRVRQLLDHFLDEVLYAVLDGYEQQLSFAGTKLDAHIDSDDESAIDIN